MRRGRRRASVRPPQGPAPPRPTGPRARGCELADEAELVAEGILHHRPVDQRPSAFVRVRHGVHRWRVLQPAADRFDLRDRGVDVLDADVDVRAVRRRIEPPRRVDGAGVRALRRRDAVEDDLVLPGLLVLVAEIGEPVGPGGRDRWKPRHFGPERCTDLEVLDVDHETAKRPDRQSAWDSARSAQATLAYHFLRSQQRTIGFLET